MTAEKSPPSPADLRAAFGVEAGPLKPHPGGFEADAFTDGRWFVKLWRGRPDSERALALTGRLAAHGLPVPAALQARDGAYTVVQHGRPYAVFPFVAGRQGTWDDAEAIARAMRAVHELPELGLDRTEITEPCVEDLRACRDHPWLVGYQDEVLAGVDRLAAVIERARSIDVTSVVCHHDLLPQNVLLGDDGRVVAVLDWGVTALAPREHDLFAALCGPDPVRFLTAYGAEGLDPTHLEYARLARSLRDLAARICGNVDRAGVLTWGIEGLRRVDADLELARPFCR